MPLTIFIVFCVIMMLLAPKTLAGFVLAPIIGLLGIAPLIFMAMIVVGGVFHINQYVWGWWQCFGVALFSIALAEIWVFRDST